MEYVNLGRKLGIGTRIAAKILRDRTQKAGSAAGPKAPVTVKPPAAQTKPRAHAEKRAVTKPIDTRAVTRNLGRGVARGGRGFWKPFSRIAHELWHEVTGVFFAIFALFFAQNLWRVRDAWKFGPEHRHFVIYLVFTLVFAYFSITAFVTSRRPKH